MNSSVTTYTTAQNSAPVHNPTEIHKLLAKPICQSILGQLQKQPRYPTELAKLVNAPQSSISNMLKAMTRAGIVQPLNRRRTKRHSAKCQLYALRESAYNALSQIESAISLI